MPKEIFKKLFIKIIERIVKYSRFNVFSVSLLIEITFFYMLRVCFKVPIRGIFFFDSVALPAHERDLVRS